MRRVSAPIVIFIIVAKVVFLSIHLSNMDEHSEACDSAVAAFEEAQTEEEPANLVSGFDAIPDVYENTHQWPDENEVVNADRYDDEGFGDGPARIQGVEGQMTTPNASESFAQSFAGSGDIVRNPYADAVPGGGVSIRNQFVSQEPAAAPVRNQNAPAPYAAPRPEPVPDVNRDWLEGDDAKRQRLAGLEARGDAPEFTLHDWKNSRPLELDDLRGKVVVLDFWATWCGPCIEKIADNNDLYRRYRHKDVVIIGVCNPEGSEDMEALINEHGVRYPCGVDEGKSTIKSYRVNGYPDYYIIDQLGQLRFADIRSSHVEDAIEMLLDER